MTKDNFIKRGLGPYYSIFIMSFFLLCCFSFSRIILISYDFQRIGGIGNLFTILLNGLRIDIVTISYISALPVLIIPFLEGYSLTHKIYSRIMVFWFCFWCLAAALMESSTPAFIDQYDVRPNRLFAEYLVYPKEVFEMLLKGYWKEMLAGVILIGIAGKISYKLGNSLFLKPSGKSFKSRIILLPFVAVIVFAGARSSIGHRPLCPANVAFSTDSLLNDLGLNSLYSFLYAVYRMKDEGDAAKLYGSMEHEKMVKIMMADKKAKNSQLQNDDSIRRYLEASNKTGEKFNIVIILEESMGAEFVGRLGGANLTPNLDRLAKEGLWFENLYATGTRSVRGIEAVISGFPPTPGRSTVKLGKSQKDFFTIAGMLSSQGYSTSFIYGGDSNFDNMRKFFLGNGFQKVIDERDYKKPKFKSTWGVSDEDLFNKANEVFEESGSRPFFSLVFTSSNHTPFEVPEMEKGFYPDQGKTVNNAVKYSDHALGKFFEKAKKSGYWKNTLFLVVADHNSRVYGNKIVPVERFRIPGLIIAPGVKPGQFNPVASQIDLPLTILSMAGISGFHPMPGRDLTKVDTNYKGRALLQFYKKNGYFTGKRLLVLEPGKKYSQFKYTDNSLIKEDLNKDILNIALANAIWPYWVYDRRLYR